MSLKDRVGVLEGQLLLMKGRMAYQEKFTANTANTAEMLRAHYCSNENEPHEEQGLCFPEEGEQYNYPQNMTDARVDNWAGFSECVIASPGRLDRVVRARQMNLKEGFFVHIKGEYLHGKRGDYLVIFKDGSKAVYTEDEFLDMKREAEKGDGCYWELSGSCTKYK